MTYRRGSHVAWREVGEETVLIHLRTKRVFGLNPAAGRVWRELAVGSVTAAGDFLAELEAEGLVEPADESAVTGPAFSLDGRPAILWREVLTSFLGACPKLPQDLGPCATQPELS